MYVNEETVPHVSNHKYLITPFPLTHKILSFVIHDQQTRGRGYWKLNSSVLNDNAYVAMVTQTIDNVDKLNIKDTQQWWDIFLLSIHSKTVEYTKEKHTVENSARDAVRKGLLDIEAIPADQLSLRQTAHYAYLKEKLCEFEEKLVEGYHQRTRGLPKYEQREPDIAFYAKLQQRSAHSTVIGELRHKNGEVYSDNPTLLNIVTDFYTDLYTPSPVDVSVQERLLGNVDRTLSNQQRCMLDADFTPKELRQAVHGLNDEKSPGIDGFMAEFYKKFWNILSAHYTAFVNGAKTDLF